MKPYPLRTLNHFTVPDTLLAENKQQTLLLFYSLQLVTKNVKVIRRYELMECQRKVLNTQPSWF